MLCLDLKYPDRICFRYIVRHIWKMKLYLALVFELCLGDNNKCHTFVSHIRKSVAKLRIAKIRSNVILLVAVERNIKRHRKSEMVVWGKIKLRGISFTNYTSESQNCIVLRHRIFYISIIIHQLYEFWLFSYLKLPKVVV